MKISDKKVYQAVYERSLMMGDDGTEYPACEYVKDGKRCEHNGSKWKLEMAHIINKPRITSTENVKFLCYYHHRTIYHGAIIPGGI